MLLVLRTVFISLPIAAVFMLQTDAFGQLEPGEGRAVDGNSASSSWMNGWTVFYMACTYHDQLAWLCLPACYYNITNTFCLTNIQGGLLGEPLSVSSLPVFLEDAPSAQLCCTHSWLLLCIPSSGFARLVSNFVLIVLFLIDSISPCSLVERWHWIAPSPSGRRTHQAW